MENEKKKSFKKIFGRFTDSTKPDEAKKIFLSRTLSHEETDNALEKYRRFVGKSMSDEQKISDYVGDWQTQFSPIFFHTSHLRAHPGQTRTSTGSDPIRSSIEEMVDTRMAENMPMFERIVDSMIKKRFENLEESGVHEVQSPVNTFQLTKDQIKETILNETKIGDVFYPSDIANHFGLELKTVIDVIEELKREGKISESPKQE